MEHDILYYINQIENHLKNNEGIEVHEWMVDIIFCCNKIKQKYRRINENTNSAILACEQCLNVLKGNK